MTVARLASSFYDEHPRLSRFLAFASAPILVLLIYLPALGHGLVWDDHLTFEQTAAYRHSSLSGILVALSQPLAFDANYFRPLTLLTFLLQIKWFGVDAFGLHLVSLLLHAANTMLLSLLIWKTLERRDEGTRLFAVAAGGLLYGLHPALIEPTAFISSRFDLLATLFMTMALLADRLAVRPVVRFISIAGLFLAAALSKEMALALPLCLPFIHLAVSDPAAKSLKEKISDLLTRDNLTSYVAIFVGGLAYLVIRYATLGYLLNEGTIDRADIGNAANHLALVGKSASIYFTMIVLPFGSISPSHPVLLPQTFTDAGAWLGIALMVVAVVTSLMTLSGMKEKIAWSLSALLASLLPILNIIPTGRPAELFFAESFLVFPLLVSVYLLVHLVFYFGNSRSFRYAIGSVFAAWMLLSMFTIVTTLPLWKNDASLWGWVATKQQFRNRTAVTNLVNGLILEKRFPEAISAAREAVHNFPDNDNSWNSLAIALTATGAPAEAEQAHRTAINLAPEESRYHSAYGGTLIKLSRLEDANKQFQAALKLDPHNTNALLGSAYIADKSGDLDTAIRLLETVISYTPPGADRDRYRQWQSNISARKINRND